MGKVIDLDESQGGGGTGTGWSGQVEFRSDLPITVGTPALGDIYLVEKPTTILFGSYTTYQSGLYIRDLNNGNLNDWRRLNVKVKFTDSEFTLVSAADQSKQAKFDLSLISASTTRTIILKDEDGTLALLSDTFYNNDGTLTGFRTINGGGFGMIMNLDTFSVVSINGLFLTNTGPGSTTIQSTGIGDIDISSLSGTGDVKLQNLCYPKTDGLNGWVLTTNGSSILSFQQLVFGSNYNYDERTTSASTTGANIIYLTLTTSNLQAGDYVLEGWFLTENTDKSGDWEVDITEGTNPAGSNTSLLDQNMREGGLDPDNYNNQRWPRGFTIDVTFTSGVKNINIEMDQFGQGTFTMFYGNLRLYRIA